MVGLSEEKLTFTNQVADHAGWGHLERDYYTEKGSSSKSLWECNIDYFVYFFLSV